MSCYGSNSDLIYISFLPIIKVSFKTSQDMLFLSKNLCNYCSIIDNTNGWSHLFLSVHYIILWRIVLFIYNVGNK